MTSKAILLVALLNQGHWIGGQPGEITLQWAAKSDTPASVVKWQLTYGQAQLGSGHLALPDGQVPSKLTITAPPVRAITEAQWVYTVQQADTGKIITKGQVALHLYPADLLAPIAASLGAKSLAVWDQEDRLPALLKSAKIDFTQIHDESNLQFSRYDILIIGQDQLADRALGQSAWLGYVQNGAAALLLPQTRVKTLAGYPLRQRPVPANLTWRANDPLLQHLRARALDAGHETWAMELPADEPALELVYWPREVAGVTPAPIDALLVTKSVGQGRFVLSQVPLGTWKQDPLAQLFLVDAIDYLAGRPEPTPPPSRRPQASTIEVAPRVPQLLPPVETQR